MLHNALARAGWAIIALALLAGCSNESDDLFSSSTRVPPVFPPGGDADVALLENFAHAQVLPANNWWNLDISNAPVDAGSQAYIDWISGRDEDDPDSRQRLHPDMAAPPWGIPYIGVGGDQPLEPVSFTGYARESDAGAPGRPAGYPIPEAARDQPNYIENAVAGGNTSGDRHMLIIDRDNWILYELYKARWTGERWEASCGAVFDLKTNARRPEGWTSTDAAGLAIFPGLVRRDEVIANGPITHAFRVATRATNGFVWPASHEAGDTQGAPPLGTRLRLKASKDLTKYPADVRKIFQAMKTYGLIIADNGGNMYVTGTMDPEWDNGVLNPAFHSLYADDFEVIRLGWGASLSP
jgi:hypothetical protein